MHHRRVIRKNCCGRFRFHRRNYTEVAYPQRVFDHHELFDTGIAMLRITLAQINPTAGDIVGNIVLARRAAAKAAADHAAMVVLPELSLTGYYPGDLLDEPAFLARVDQGL